MTYIETSDLNVWQRAKYETMLKAIGLSSAVESIQEDINALNDKIAGLTEQLVFLEASTIVEVSAETLPAEGKNPPKARFSNSDTREAETNRRLSGNREYVRLKYEKQELYKQVRSKTAMLNGHTQQIEIYKAFLKGS